MPTLHRATPPASDEPPSFDGTEKPIGNDRSWRALVDWFIRSEPRLQVVHGPTGCGKTFAVGAIAFQQNVKITELNGSEKRTADVVGDFLSKMCATLQRRILLLDDADSMDKPAFHTLVEEYEERKLRTTVYPSRLLQIII